MSSSGPSDNKALLSSAFGFILFEQWPDLSAQLSNHEDQMMYRALQLASKGVGRTHPNPPVGAVIAKSGRIIAEGYHERAGLAHAEAKALQSAGEASRDAELFNTLEPCTHFGRTPPCLSKVIASGVSKIRIGTLDPNPKVNGQGMKALLDANFDAAICSHPLLQTLSQLLIAPFATSVAKNRPYVILKIASSLDGKVAKSSGVRTLITGKASSKLVHRLRDNCDAIVVGRRTVEIDDPLLTVRDIVKRDDRQPLRVVFDSDLSLSSSFGVFSSSDCVVVHDMAAPEDKKNALDMRGIARIPVVGEKGFLSVEESLGQLAQQGLTSVLVEGGPQMWTSFINAGLIDEIWWFSAPCILGTQGVSAVEMLSPQAQNWLMAPEHRSCTLAVDHDQLTIIRIQKSL